MKTAAQHLIEHGIRPSVQRVAIMDYLMQHHTHPTVDTIYHDLLDAIPTLSRTTVYNTLELLLSNNAVLALTIDSHTVHYDGNVEPHAHFLCRRCGQIIDLPVTKETANTLKLDDCYKIEQIQLNYYGVCDRCNKENDDN